MPHRMYIQPDLITSRYKHMPLGTEQTPATDWKAYGIALLVGVGLPALIMAATVGLKPNKRRHHKKMRRNDALHERIAEVLGWPVKDTYGFDLQSLREMVRHKSPKLAAEITERITSGSYIVGSRHKRKYRRNGGKAVKVRHLGEFGDERGSAARVLWKVPRKGLLGKLGAKEYVVTSQSTFAEGPNYPPETYIFKATKSGKFDTSRELPGSAKGLRSHADAMRRAGYRVNGSRKTSADPKMTLAQLKKDSMIRMVVGNYHVGTPDAEIEENFRARCAKAGYSKSFADKVVKAALHHHHQNRSLYGYVMGGMKHRTGGKMNSNRKRHGKARRNGARLTPNEWHVHKDHKYNEYFLNREEAKADQLARKLLAEHGAPVYRDHIKWSFPAHTWRWTYKMRGGAVDIDGPMDVA